VAQLAIAVALATAARLEIVRPVAVGHARAIDLAAEEIAVVVRPVEIVRAIGLAARLIDLAARVIAVEVVQIVLGVGTLEALGIGAPSETDPDIAAAVRAQAAVGVLPAWVVREGALVEVAVEVSVAAAVVAVVAVVAVAVGGSEA
jgi:hypothetical protein